MSGGGTAYEIYREIFVDGKSPRLCTAIINRCDLNSKTGQEYFEFLIAEEYLSAVGEGEKTRYLSTSSAGEYITLFSPLYQKLFDRPP